MVKSMEEYGNLMGDGKHAEAFDKISRESNFNFLKVSHEVQ